jgi:hypothetical protein
LGVKTEISLLHGLERLCKLGEPGKGRTGERGAWENESTGPLMLVPLLLLVSFPVARVSHP